MAETIYSQTDLKYCQHSLEAYKFLKSAPADLHAQSTQYQQYREQLAGGQHCCPALRQKVAALTPAITDPAVELPAFPVDIIFADNGPCGRFFFRSGAEGAAAAEGKAWLEEFQKQRTEYWEKTYGQLSADLQACCRRQLQQCLAAAPRDPSGQAAAPAAAQQCLQRSTPPAPAAPPGKSLPASPAAATEAAAKQLGEAIVASSTPLREQACREQLFFLVNSNNILVDEYHRCAQDKQTAFAQTQAAAEERSRCQQQAGEGQAEVARLQRELTAATVVRPGRELLSALTEGQLSGELALFGGIALLAGALAGLLGQPSLRSRLRAGATGALIALLVFCGFVALLPDTLRTDLLLALAGTMLVTALGALLRVSLLLKRCGPEPHSL